jgi:hypothetical protein
MTWRKEDGKSTDNDESSAKETAKTSGSTSMLIGTHRADA